MNSINEAPEEIKKITFIIMSFEIGFLIFLFTVNKIKL